ncbi:hypothetical protein [Paraburkholderia flagellata]|uniref:hypothetical protein n=1 Tax=Paraburkholderia flagellata TaxID=2883241 RepID=UPI001F417718|nr:hypothetical protein [Paraburkholderia flagellata]
MSDSTPYLVEKFGEAEKILSAFLDAENNADQLVSIKLRPVATKPGSPVPFLYKEDYDEIYACLATLGTSVGDSQLVQYGPGTATVYRLDTGHCFLFIEHETGPDLITNLPDLIAYLHAARDVLEAATPALLALPPFLRAVNKVAKVIQKLSKDRSMGSPYNEIDVIRRTAKGERTLRALRAPENPEEAIQTVNEVVGYNLALGHWQLVANGYVGDLWIESVNGDTFEGAVQDDGNVIRALEGPKGTSSPTWNAAAGQVVFARTLANGELQTFTGYIFDRNVQLLADRVINELHQPQAYPYPGPALAGTFTANKYEARENFGWFALYMPIEP